MSLELNNSVSFQANLKITKPVKNLLSKNIDTEKVIADFSERTKGLTTDMYIQRVKGNDYSVKYEIKSPYTFNIKSFSTDTVDNDSNFVKKMVTLYKMFLSKEYYLNAKALKDESDMSYYIARIPALANNFKDKELINASEKLIRDVDYDL